MKIAIVGMSPNVGGVETFILNIYRELKKEGHQFFFLTSANKICYETEILENDDKIVYYTPRKKNYLSFRKNLYNIFKEYSFDVFWLNCCSLSCIDELIYAWKAKVPIRIVHSHNSENMGSRITNFLHLYHRNNLYKYITHSFACSDIAAKWMFPEDIYKTTKILCNSVDANKFKYDKLKMDSIKKSMNLEDYVIIGHVGRFHFQKNHSFILEVFKETKKIIPNSKLMLCGEGELEFQVKEKAIEYGIIDSVIFMGNQKEMEKIYQSFDIMIFPSLFEGLPFALVEAQAAGVPCLISDTISKEVAITNLVQFESLDLTATEWAYRLKDCLNIDKRDTLIEIQNAGYDSKENFKQLNLYIINELKLKQR